MATLSDLEQALGDGEMINLVAVASQIKAAAIVQEATPSAERLAFAQESLKNPHAYSGVLWRYVVGANSSANIGEILRSVSPTSNPTDSTLQTNVDAAIDKFWP